MSEFLEEADNLLVQVYYEFAVFLFLVQRKSADKYLHNIMMDATRIHIRVLADFFSSKRNNPSDLLYSDFLINCPSIQIDLPRHIRHFINQSTAHLTKGRGKNVINDQEFRGIVSSIVSSIHGFTSQANRANLKDEYKSLLDDEALKEIKAIVEKDLLSFLLLNNSSLSN